MPRRAVSEAKRSDEPLTPFAASVVDEAAADLAADVRVRPPSRKPPLPGFRLIDETRTPIAGLRCLTCSGRMFERPEGDAICERGHEAGGLEDDPIADRYATDTLCPDCGGRQYRCASGVVCAEGHRYGQPSYIPSPDCEPESRRQGSAADDLARDVEKSTARLSPDFERVVERIFDVDFADTYERLERELSLGGRASHAERAMIVDALDRSQDNARDAHRLYAAARVDLEAFELDARAILADMRAQATAALEADRTVRKKAKESAKQITEADVEDWCLAHFRDEWRDLQIRRKRAEKGVESLERLAELWRSRSKTLEALLASART